MMVHEYTTEDFMEAILDEARDEGRKEGIKNTARNMLKQGDTLDKIQTLTDLDIETIKSLM
jgi:predicted transposase/invertase (TIGR01784 family)